jgi:predicted dienelactone hydrolase
MTTHWPAASRLLPARVALPSSCRHPVLLLLLIARPSLAAQEPTSATVQVPPPSGPFAVGRASFHWTDSSRTEPFAPALSDRREVMVYVWYPAERGSAKPEAAYIPHLDAIARSIGDSLVRAEFGAALPGVAAGRVHSYTVDHAALSRAEGVFPVLVFSHGFGESSLTYSAQLADLASHGFVVFGIEHPYDAFAVWLPDGRVVPFAAALWDSARGRKNGAVAYQLAQVPVRAADIRFVLDRIVDLDHAPAHNGLFAGRLDVKRIGVFGHSLGGIAAASACRTDVRIRACANEDADDDGRPFDGGTAAMPIKQPFLFMATGHSIYVSRRTPLPSDADLVKMNLTRVQYDSIVSLYQHNQDTAMASFPGGAVRVMAESPTFTHRTFIDLKLLQATADSTANEQRRYLTLIRRVVRAFFARTLLARPDSLLDSGTAVDSIITVQRYGPA